MWNKFSVMVFIFMFSTSTWAEFYIIGHSSSAGFYQVAASPVRVSGPYPIVNKKPIKAKPGKKQPHAVNMKPRRP